MSTASREEFVKEARSWIGTPYQHQGRIKGVACDCIGLVIGTARALGLTDYDIDGYGKRPDGNLRPVMESQLESVPLDAAQAADVVLFAWASHPLHVGILSDPSHVIHAYLPNRRVVENIIDERWRAQIVAAYHMPGVV
ncbi:peptidase P60 [Paraburkholderia panacisoli]|uniref:Peptidase P60 n=1 Tax=Paraburkholderia panacisoli TaxID=2603818 RepID=A0A5B0HLG4_9BURK|nr:NlpC/P60 family protein [Paraburkholderia panacisoli]KAA1015980.1 peptidase P60 [Paraburkholderia panacisoli]